LEPEDIKTESLGAIWSFSKVTGLPWIDMGHKGSLNWGLGAKGPKVSNPIVNQSNNQSRLQKDLGRLDSKLDLERQRNLHTSIKGRSLDYVEL
jgi:hypothetical protein